MLLTLRYLEGYNSAEPGKIFGLPSGTVRSRLSEARGRLRQSLEETGGQGKRRDGKKGDRRNRT